MGAQGLCKPLVGVRSSHPPPQENIMQKIKVLWISWTQGKVFQFGTWYFNGGRSYKVYRLGPLYIRVYDRP